MKKLEITNAFICTIENRSITPVFGDLLIVNGKIVSITPKEFHPGILTEPAKLSNEHEVYNSGGRVVTIPLVNFHDHIYSRLAKGLPTKGDSSNFENILKYLWWILDEQLDLDMTEASTQMDALESIRAGVTYIFDHHSSPTFAAESLRTIRDTLDSFKLRGVLCFESTDRNGQVKSDAGLEENADFMRKYTNENFKGMFGLHASFTLNDDTLARVSRLIQELNAGIHIHLCEGVADRDNSKLLYGDYPLERLKKFALLNDKSIVAHGIHLKPQEIEEIKKYNTQMVFNLDSNLNNSVGTPNFGKISDGNKILAGTDGMHANISRSLKQIFLISRMQQLSFGDAFGMFINMYFNQVEFAQKYFPDFPLLQVNGRADFIVWDYVVPTPLTGENFWGHYIYGMLEYPVRSVVQNGNFLMKDYVLQGINEAPVQRNIYEQGQRLLEKFVKA
jgi:cytosine/adenosine deaminase-related metal-dependent hydrolase